MSWSPKRAERWTQQGLKVCTVGEVPKAIFPSASLADLAESQCNLIKYTANIIDKTDADARRLAFDRPAKSA
jgi:hypothetical protein